MPDDVISVFAVDSSIFLSHTILLFFAIISRGPKAVANLKKNCAEYSIFLRKVTSGDPHQSASFSFCHLFTLTIDFGCLLATLSDLLPPSGLDASLTLFSAFLFSDIPALLCNTCKIFQPRKATAGQICKVLNQGFALSVPKQQIEPFL